MMLQARYWISELADLTGVSPRTIRYYITEGLLPPPEIQGKYAVFDEGYVVRLKLIKYLKDAYLPLREIKMLLDRWDEHQIRDKLAEFEQNPFEAARNLGRIPSTHLPSSESGAKESAAEYLSNVMERPSKSEKREHRPHPQSPREIQDQFKLLQEEYMKMESTPASESWQRVRISEDIEMWLRQPVSSDVQVKLDWIIEQVRSLFASREEKGNGTNQDTA